MVALKTTKTNKNSLGNPTDKLEDLEYMKCCPQIIVRNSVTELLSTFKAYILLLMECR